MGLSPRSRDGMPRRSETVRARVRHWRWARWCTTRGFAARYGLTPSCGQAVARGSTRSATPGTPPVGGLGWGSDEGRRRAFLCGATAAQVAAVRAAVARWSPFRRGRRAKEARARAVAPLRYPEVAQDVSVQRLVHGPLRHFGRAAPSRPEQRNNVARSSEGQPFTTGMNAWPGLSRLVQVPAWRPVVLHRRKRRRLLSTVA